MKAARFFSAVLCGALLLCGCERGGAPSDGSGSASVIYESDGYIQMIACENGELYALTSSPDPESDGYSARLAVYNAEGELTDETTVPVSDSYNIRSMCADGGKLYFAVVEGDNTRLCEWTRGVELGTVAELEGFSDVKKLAVSGGRLYWLGTSTKNARYADPFTCKSGETLYYNGIGGSLGAVDLADGSVSESPFEFPAALSVNGEGVWVYGFDDVGGYYFAEYSAPDNRIYTERLGEITAFEMLGEGRFAFIGSPEFPHTLAVSAVDGKSGVVAAAENVDAIFPKSLCADGEYVYVVTDDENEPQKKCVKRFYMGNITTGKPVRLITTRSDQTTPHSAGAETELKRLSVEEFALTVLALDRSFDCALLSSEDGCAHDVMSKGSFYPLNDVPNVAEYLDKCFPYIKEAATTEDGEIWMLPIEIDVPLLVYNAENCADIAFPTDWEDFIAEVKRAGERSEYCECLRFRLVQSFFSQWLSGHESFDEPEFCRVAELIKSECSGGAFVGNFDLQQSLLEHQWTTTDRRYKTIYDNYLFSLVLYRRFQVGSGLIGNDDLRAVPLPVLDGTKNGAICTFLCVNPFSDRLDETLQFISQLALHLGEQRDGLMLSDKALYGNGEYAQSLYEVYANSDIIFDVPSEIYWQDFERYCNDEITLDDFVSEAGRKLAAYLNE